MICESPSELRDSVDLEKREGGMLNKFCKRGSIINLNHIESKDITNTND